VEDEVNSDDIADRIIFLMALGVLLWAIYEGAAA
jgi:hypothetical protein